MIAVNGMRPREIRAHDTQRCRVGMGIVRVVHAAWLAVLLVTVGCDSDSATKESGPSAPSPDSDADAKSADARPHDATQGGPAADASSQPEPFTTGYARPGSEPGVPGPSTRILQPTSVTRLTADPPDWLYLRGPRALHRIATPVEEHPPQGKDGQLIAKGPFSGPWLSDEHVFFMGRLEWTLYRWRADKTPKATAEERVQDIDQFPLEIPIEEHDLGYNGPQGQIYGDHLYLASGGCGIFTRVTFDGVQKGALRTPEPGLAVRGSSDSIQVNEHGVFCMGHSGGHYRFWKVDHEMTQAQELWNVSDTLNPPSSPSVSDIVAAKDKVYWVVTAFAYPEPAEMYAYDASTDEVELIKELETQSPKWMTTDRDDRLYWRVVDRQVRTVLRTFDLDRLEVIHGLNADFGLTYVDDNGVEQHTAMGQFALTPEYVYWKRGNPGSRPNDAGDDIMRFPRNLIDP